MASSFVSAAIPQSSTLVELLRWRALNQPDKRAYTFLLDGETEEATFTYEELDAKARVIGGWLQSSGMHQERVLLLYPAGLEYIAAFFGCLYAGAIAVPIYLPRLNRNLLRLQTIVTDAQATLALTTASIFSQIEPLLTQAPLLETLGWQVTDELASDSAGEWRDPSLTGSSLAFLQYTSGSTAAPKGVMVSHDNLMNNERMIQSKLCHSEQSIFVGWLPLYHDMGLIGNVLQPLYVGIPSFLMSPMAFLERPIRWLQAISRYKGTSSGGPNFAYDLCVRKVTAEQREMLDLSSWDVAFNGAEPVRHKTLERFASTFAGCGFRREAFFPCYGLAEATLIVSGGPRELLPLVIRVQDSAFRRNEVVISSNNENVKHLVSCGETLKDHRVVISDPESLTTCPPNRIGEIWVSGPSVTRGYWKKPEETRQTFHAYLADTGEGPFLRTGDLGFIREGELFVAGRLKDLIIIRGSNYYPQDIELAVETSHAALRPGCCAAFSVDVNNEEQMVIVVEADERHRTFNVDEVVQAIGQSVAEQYELQVPNVVLIQAGTIPKTTSGKLQRYACRENFLRGSLKIIGGTSDIQKIPAIDSLAKESVAKSQPLGLMANETERLKTRAELLAVSPENRRQRIEQDLTGWLIRLLKLPTANLNVSAPLYRLGVDSLVAAELKTNIEENFGANLPITAFLDEISISQLAAQVLEHVLAQTRGGKADDDGLLLPQIQTDPEHRNLPFPLTDIQQAYLIGRTSAFEMGNVSIHFYAELDCAELDVERLSAAWRKLVQRHDMLRAIVLPDGRQQILEHVPEYEIVVSDQLEKGSETAVSAIEETRKRLSHQVLPFDRWPLFEISATLYDHNRVRLHISIDGLHIDGASLMILFREWTQLYRNVDTPVKPLELSYRDHVLADLAIRNTELYQRSLDYWRRRVAKLPPAPELPIFKNPASLAEPKFSHRSARVDPEIWLRVKAQATKLGLSPSAVLLAAYAEVLAVWSRHPQFTVNVTLFNRFFQHPQAKDILGNFTSLILLDVDTTRRDTFETRAKRLQKQLWTDLEYRHVSGVQALREFARVQKRTSQSVMPIVFTSLLSLGTQGFQSPLATLSELGTMVYSITQTPQVWLDNQVFEDSGALVLNWDAVDELFPPGLIDDVFSAYHRLVESLADEKSWQSTQFELVPESQIEKRAAVNDTSVPIPNELLQTLFEQKVLEQSDRPAVIASRITLTYGELNRQANRIAHRLRELGVKPNTLVAIVMEKGWEQIVAVLGVVKAGGAYIPVDANFPNERTRFLIENSEAKAILTQSWIIEKLEFSAGLPLICVDKDDLSGLPESSPEPVQKQEDLAYVLYTSGSTGKPKGVMIEQRSVVNRMIDVANRFQLGPEDRAIALTPLHHDLSVFDIFGMLSVVGGSIVLPDADGVRDPAHWTNLIVKEGVTVWNSVPTFMQMLTEYLENAPDQPDVVTDSLRLVIMSGDFIPVDLPDRIRQLIRGVNVVSAGGPTETTVWDICYPIGEVDPGWKSIPYGRPMANAEYHVLNDKFEPRPVWVAGELCIAGAGIARGYWRDEEKTSASFVTHPQTGHRLYRSGDIGRYLPDGNIEILGRDDLQIKIRGLRIELGEIETTLERHPSVRAAVVSAIGNEHEDKRLVAYVVPRAEKTRVSEEKWLQDHNANQLKGVIDDPIERMEFKLKELGLRPDENGKTHISLIRPHVDDRLIRSYMERQSYRSFKPEPITFDQFSGFISLLRQIKPDTAALPKYRYPSAGGLYPNQIYLYIKPERVEGVASGTYYYHPRDHELVLLSASANIDRNVHIPTNQSVFDESAFSLFLIGQMSAISPMYGDLSRDFCMLEAGYISQLLMMSASANQIGLCPIGGFDFEPVRSLFLLDENHIFLHSLVGGRIDPVPLDQTTQVSNAGKQSVLSTPQSNGDLIGTLRTFLQRELPEYMVPSSFIMIEALPLTANGKVDRQALPSPAEAVLDSKKSYVAPTTDIERTLATILQEVLQVQSVGVKDNFFDLGANSLHIVEAHTKLRTALNRDISVKEMFKYPSISLLAEHLSQQQAATQPAFQRIHDRARKQLAAIKRQKQHLE